MSTRAFITGVSGTGLTAAEREFIRAERPWGFILFKRNVEKSGPSYGIGCGIARGLRRR